MKQLDIYSSQIQRVYLALEDEIIKMLIKRLNTKGLDGDNFNVYSWHLDRLNQLGALNEETAKLVSKATKISKPLIEKMIKGSGYDIAEATSKTLSNGLGVDKLPVSSNVDMILRNMLKQTFLDLDNYVNQTLITTNAGQGVVSKAYQSILENMVANVTTGTTTAKKVLNKAMYKLVDSGLESGLIDKGGHHWSVEAYTRTVLDSTKYRVMNETRMEQAHEYDVHTFVMSSHPASRAACAPIQGKVVNDVPTSSPKYDSRYPSIYDHGYGEPAGCFGINCHHMKYPFIPGVNTNHQKQYDPIEAQENGKIQQKQRQLERAIRNSKRKLNTANELGDREGAERFKLLIRKQQGALRQFIGDNEFLHRDYSREKVVK
ncbi:phage minor capsid protein [Latilactobacillus curvatus]|uniref:phage minor capsid protein n=1 Tax=Latilactobacillus curvatus TaxID=28038 RepID=UPI001BFFE4D7|nr:phage minor capsid protein [Latilactobacillus curvatus]QWF35095.1 phage minor capsid protein [Latilactobacillus curvatus]